MKNIFILFLFIRLIICGLFAQTTCDCWIPMDTSFHVVPITQGPAAKDTGVAPKYENDDGSTLPIKLPFTFCFYGQNFDTVYINNNGNISFIKPITAFVSGAFPFGTDTLMIAPFYSDIDTRMSGGSFFGNGIVYYKITPTHMIVKWDAVGYQGFDVDFFNTFQLIITNGTDPILPEGNNVSFCYNDMGWASSEVSGGGWGGWNGIPATIGVNKGNKIDFAQFGRFNLPGDDYTGPLTNTNGLYWLNGKSFIFNTCVTGNNIPPVIVRSPQTTCDTIKVVCPWETITVTATAAFLSPIQGQTSILSASSNSVTVSILNATTVNSISTITVQITPSPSEAGVHVLNIIATDNSVPTQTNTSKVILVIEDCGTDNLSEVTSFDNFNIYPSPGNGNLIIQVDDQQLLLNSEVKIYDIFGRETYSVKLNNTITQINLSEKSKGIYFLKLYKENIPITLKKIITQ